MGRGPPQRLYTWPTNIRHNMSESVLDVLKERDSTFAAEDVSFDDPEENPADLDPYYESLENYVRMVTGGYSNLLVLDAAGGLGKTYNIKRVLRDELEEDQWSHVKGFTTPVELYKTLYMAQEQDHVLFLDDISGIGNNQKALDLLKAATDTEGEENWVEYRTSRTMEHPDTGRDLPNTFCYRGRIIMSFNSTPDSADFAAFVDRGTYYNLDFTYEERMSLIREIAKLEDFSPLSVEEQQETAEWIETVTDHSVEVSIRTFENVCQMRYFGKKEEKSWERLALDVFDLDYEKYVIVSLMDTELPVMEQIDEFKSLTGRSQGHYYNLKNEIRSSRL